MRLDVSWIVSRIVFMPSIVRRTASPPLCATSTECLATSEERSALPETSSIDAAIETIDSVAALISRDWFSAALAMCDAVLSVCFAAESTMMAVSLTVATSLRNSSMA